MNGDGKITQKEMGGSLVIENNKVENGKIVYKVVIDKESISYGGRGRNRNSKIVFIISIHIPGKHISIITQN